MPGRAPYLLRWSPQKHTYEISAKDIALPCGFTPGDPAWFAWLDGITSFAFYSRTGAYCTVRKETIQRSGAYWYGYRSVQRRTAKRYIGRTADLSIARLEESAESFTTVSPVQNATQEQPTAEPVLTPHLSSTELPPLLEARLHPPRLPLELVERPQLFARLDAWCSYKLTLLCAPAGFGKTTLVNAWLARCDILSQAAWISLDTGDNDPARFWRYVFTVCQADPDQYILPLLFSSPLPSLQLRSLKDVLISFLNAATRQEQHRLLILDDYHVISEPGIHETLSFCLTHLPEMFHILLITRSAPPLSLGRLRAGGEINEILAADLRFSREECLAFLQQTVASPLSTEVLESLAAHLEGWVAGLRLLSLSLQRKITQSQIEHLLATFRGSHRSIRDYFVAEVLHAQPKELQDFLLYTSVLPRLSASLCVAVTGQQESAAFLETIERANLFLEALDGAGEWYRYYTPFAEAMRAEALRQLGEEKLRLLSHAASCWFEEHGLLSEAIEAALKAEESARAAVLIERYVQVSLRKFDEYHTIRHWMAQLPETTLTQSPLLCLTYAVSLVFGRDSQMADPTLLERIEALLQRAEESWRSNNNLVGLGEIFAFRALFTYQQGKRKQAVIWARQALAWLPTTDTWRGMSLGTLGIEALLAGQLNEAQHILQELRTLAQAFGEPHILAGITLVSGFICFEQGELHQAARYFRTLYDNASLRLESPVSATAQLCLAQVLYDWNDLEMAQQQTQEALDLGEQFTGVSQEELQMPIELMRARLLHAQGETAFAIQRLATLLPHLRSHPNPFFLYFYQEALGWLVRFSLLLGDRDAAQDWLHDFPYQRELLALPASDTPLLTAPATQSVPEPVQADSHIPVQEATDVPAVFQEQREMLLARLSLAQGEAEAALTILNALLSPAQEAGRERSVLQIKLLMVQAYAACAHRSEAHKLLLEALKQGYTEGNQRIFLDEGEKLFHLLRDLSPSLRSQPLRDYVQTLLQAFMHSHNNQSTIITSPVVEPLFEPLSAQEQRVLRLLAAGQSNLEIARELVVSVNTIRSQVQNIYRKLQVNNRHAASAAARNLHLL